MPSLTPEDRKKLLGQQSWYCPKCGKQPYKNYCRECDEFFFVCDCPPEPNTGLYSGNHEGHRTY